MLVAIVLLLLLLFERYILLISCKISNPSDLHSGQARHPRQRVLGGKRRIGRHRGHEGAGHLGASLGQSSDLQDSDGGSLWGSAVSILWPLNLATFSFRSRDVLSTLDYQRRPPNWLPVATRFSRLAVLLFVYGTHCKGGLWYKGWQRPSRGGGVLRFKAMPSKPSANLENTYVKKKSCHVVHTWPFTCVTRDRLCAGRSFIAGNVEVLWRCKGGVGKGATKILWGELPVPDGVQAPLAEGLYIDTFFFGDRPSFLRWPKKIGSLRS